jgi:hypothetical protein
MAVTKLSISSASRHTGKSRNTIAKDIREGTLSYELAPNGSKLIDVSEIARVYGDDFKIEREEGTDARAKAVEASHSDQTSRHLLEAQIAERERERRQYEQQLEHLKETLKLAQEGHNRATLLLESRSGGGDWEKSLQALKEQIANQETSYRKELTEIKEKYGRTAMQYKRAYEEEKSKPFWRKLFA